MDELETTPPDDCAAAAETPWLPPAPAPLGPGFEGDGDGLPALLHHLQGSFQGQPPDAGLARLHPDRLRLIERLARRRAESCIHGLGAVSSLLADRFDEAGMPRPDRTCAFATRLVRDLSDEHACWVRLADSARDYLQAPGAARFIAHRWQLRAGVIGEWSGGGPDAAPAPGADDV